MQETIEQLQQLSREELIKKWKKLFKTNSPQHARKEFLIKHIVWELQAKKQGSYSARTQKQLDKLADKLAKKEEIKEKEINKHCRQNSEIKTGTKLIREYKGEKHEVIALDKGFEYRGKYYKSLSAIAREITGTQWNGKVFFGIKK
ncbi:MAG: DUF2924 domain-containing protein [Candidatus Gastranaerophilales bacterium]|nr:DUF2924 domain-containing protein [Candidatus Gastranaerophilales bacterium]